MAKIWRVYEGNEPTRGGPWVELPASEAFSLFEIKPKDFVSDPKHTPRFGQRDRDQSHLGYKHIVVEIERDEAKTALNGIWEPGFYRSKVKPKDAFGKLVRQALVADLGAKNVLDVKHETAFDSHGDDALKITVVLAPNAVKKLAAGAPLNALVRLQQRLSDMGDTRTPIIEYATEAELLA
jgi:hypothetical protein